MMLIALIELILLILVFLAPTVAMLLVMWFHKNTFVEYMRFFNLTGLFYIADYLEATANDVELTYPRFLQQHWDNFTVRLIGCPVCLSVWLSGILNLVMFFLLLYFVSMPWYVAVSAVFASTFPTSYAGLYLYAKLTKLVLT